MIFERERHAVIDVVCSGTVTSRWQLYENFLIFWGIENITASVYTYYYLYLCCVYHLKSSGGIIDLAVCA